MTKQEYDAEWKEIHKQHYKHDLKLFEDYQRSKREFHALLHHRLDVLFQDFDKSNTKEV